MRLINSISFNLGGFNLYTIITFIALLQWSQLVHGINNNIESGNFRSNDLKRNTICIPGLHTWGATAPKGDIKLQIGNTLEVNCTIDRSNPKVGNLTSANIEFSFTKHDISDERMKVTIVDESTAMLRVENMSVSTPLLYCSLINPYKDNSLLHICQNQINVGYQPLEVENFRCVAKNWNSLNCTWNKPFNPVATNYELSYRLKLYSMQCGHASQYNETFSCEWNGMTEPHYQQNYEYYNLIMNGSNVLKPSGVLWFYKVHHWSIIIPAKPDKVITEAVSPTEIEVTWEFANYELFKPGLLHRVRVCTTQHMELCFTKNFTSIYKDGRLTKRIQVPYSFTEYLVEVQMKSKVSNDTEEFWSAPAISRVQTMGKKPDSPPRTTSGSFQLFNKYQIRDIFVYWQNIEPYLHNGSDFQLEFKVYENGHLRNEIRPTEVTPSAALFANMSMQSYTFEISSVNSMGKSDSFATVQVPKSPPEGAPEPLSVTKMFFSNGTYEVSWKPPANAEGIISYTIFVCNGSRHSPYQCNVLLDWNEVGADQTMFIYKDLPSHQVFQFGVSVNTKEKGSSGMVLANCELVFNKVPGKITDVRIGAATPNTIQVKWNLDCAYKPGRIDGFRITYCRVIPSSSNTCSDVETNKREIRASSEDSEYLLEHLEPFSKYMVAISIITKAGESQPSVPIFGNTAEAAPSDPPHVRAMDSTNTSGIIAIEVPVNPNGILQKFKIIYKAVDETGPPTEIERKKDELMPSNEENTLLTNLTNLENNLNYSVSVIACTVSCSNVSEPAFLMTKVGSTRLTKSPSIYYDDETFIINWDTPARIGGPVDHFEVAVKRNGEFVSPNEPYKVNFKSGQSKYEYHVHLQCETNTNLSVQVRTASLVNNETLYGDWSPEGSLSCSGIAAWILWLIGLGVATVMIIVVAILSKTFCRKLIAMKTFTIEYPFEVELDGVPPEVKIRKIRKNSGGDTHSLGKENMIYKLYLASQTDETKDFLPDSNKETSIHQQTADSAIYVGSSQENNSVGGSTYGGDRQIPLQESIDEVLKLGIGRVSDWKWQPTIPDNLGNNDGDIVACSEILTTNNSNSLTVEKPSTCSPNLSNQSSTVDDDYSTKRTSPSPSKPLLSDSIHYADDDDQTGDDDNFVHTIHETELEHYKRLGYKRDNQHPDDDYNRHYQTTKVPVPGNSVGTPTPSPSSRSHSSHSSSSSSSKEESQPNQPQSSTPPPNSVRPDSTNDMNSAPGQEGVVVPKVPITNPYITWAYLKNDPTDGDTTLTQPPYYQVGIKMDTT